MNTEQTSIHALLRQAKILSHSEMVSLEKLIGAYGPMTSQAAMTEALYYDTILSSTSWLPGDVAHKRLGWEVDNFLTYAAILEKLEK